MKRHSLMRKGLAILVLACASAAVAAKTDNMKVNNKMNQNPLLTPSTLPFGAPDFSKIKSEHYLPAIQEGIRHQRQGYCYRQAEADFSR